MRSMYGSDGRDATDRVARGRAARIKRATMSTPAATLRELLVGERADAAAVRGCLDRLDHAGRMEAIPSLGGPALQGKLYETVKGGAVVTREDLVPPDAPALREVIWHGKNSLPMFTRFQKRFCRPDGPRGERELWGYNHQTMAWATGPGYF